MSAQDITKHMTPVANGATVIYDRVRRIDHEPMDNGTFVIEFVNDGKTFLDVVEPHIYEELLRQHPDQMLQKLNAEVEAHQ